MKEWEQHKSGYKGRARTMEEQDNRTTEQWNSITTQQ